MRIFTASNASLNITRNKYFYHLTLINEMTPRLGCCFSTLINQGNNENTLLCLLFNNAYQVKSNILHT